jgi:hypothetical protein
MATFLIKSLAAFGSFADRFIQAMIIIIKQTTKTMDAIILIRAHTIVGKAFNVFVVHVHDFFNSIQSPTSGKSVFNFIPQEHSLFTAS